jgi:hypothetical protein
MESDEVEILNEISRDVMDTYNLILGSNEVLVEIYVELRLMRKLSEIS